MNESMERVPLVLQLAALMFAVCAAGVQQQWACLSSEFKCADGQCVSHSGRCDYYEDCEDGSDEKNCEENECEVNNGGCSHHCVDQPLGFRCDCPTGMRLVQDTHCEDVDLCLAADVCDQVCVHSNASFTCECRHGYVKSSESGRCLAAGDAAVLIFSSSEGIVWMKPDGSEKKKITNTSGASGAVTCFTAHNTLYWTNSQHTHIYRLVLEADVQEVCVMSGLSGVVGLAVDWIHEVLYWSSKHTGAVHAAALNGTEHTPVVSGLSSPTAVAVHPADGFLFWADAGVPPRIERSGLNGENRRTIVTSVIQNPVSIALDVPRGLLYWADSGFNTVSRVTYDGLHRKMVVESNGYLNQPYGLSVFENSVYWSDHVTGAICRADKHNGTLLHILTRVISPAGLLVYHPLLQPPDTTSSPAHLDSSHILILSLTVFSAVLFAALFHCWRKGTLSRSRFPGHSVMKESQDPLVQSGVTDADAGEVIVEQHASCTGIKQEVTSSDT